MDRAPDAHHRAVAPGLGAEELALSLHVLRRFALKCLVFLAWAGLMGALGFGFARQLASLLLMSGCLAQVLGMWRGESVRAAHWTSFDEASWLLLLGSLLQLSTGGPLVET